MSLRDPMRKLDLPSSGILCAIKCSVEPDHDAVRQYTRAAVPLWSAVFSVRARRLYINYAIVPSTVLVLEN